MIHLKDEYTFAGVFQEKIIAFTIGESNGGKDSDGWYPGNWERLGETPIAAINQYGEVFSGRKVDLQELAGMVVSCVRLWDGRCYGGADYEVQ